MRPRREWAELTEQVLRCIPRKSRGRLSPARVGSCRRVPLTCGTDTGRYETDLSAPVNRSEKPLVERAVASLSTARRLRL
ncbi:MAG: hypothetical protein M3403_06045, partial [Gemmatimonadota bacterium]|nr:hypothetical protein [Gemmatimonadota bacterium]